MRTLKQVILDDEMNKEYGHSRRTCKQTLEGYKKDRAEVENAIIWAKTL